MGNLQYIFVLAIVLAFGAVVNAQGDQVLVTGKAGLKNSDVTTMIEFYEWALEAKFTSDQRERFTENTIIEFKADPKGARKTIDDIVTTFPKIKAADDDLQRSARENFIGEFLPLVRKGEDDNSRMLLGIYESARGSKVENTESPSPQNDTIDNAKPVGNIAAISGKWAWADSGSMTKTTTGVYLGGNASRFTYEFSPNGSVLFTGIMTTMTGGCKLTAFRTVKGKASLNGDKLTIDWQPASFSRDDMCSPAKDYKKILPAEKETFTVRLKTDLGQKQLCLVASDETCYSPAN